MSTRPPGKMHQTSWFRTKLLRLFRLAMDDLTRRQPQRVMLEDYCWCAVGTHFEEHGRHRCLCNKFLAISHSITTFHVSAILCQNGFSPRQNMVRSRQFLDGFNNVTRINDVFWNDSRYK